MTANGTAAQGFSNENLNLILASIASSLSIMGTTMIFLTYALWPDMRTNSRRIVTFISVGDFLTALTNLVGLWAYKTSDLDALCEAEATLNIVAILSSFFWTVYLSLYLYLTICKNISYSSEKRVMCVFHITAWGIPVMMAVLAASEGVVGNAHDLASAGWCWIEKGKSWKTMVLWMVLTGKGWEILSYIAITLLYTLVKLHIRREVDIGSHSGSPFLTMGALEAAKKADKKFTFVPVVFIFLRMWGTIRFFRLISCLPHCFHTGALPLNKGLIILQGIGDSSQGFANFVLFCLFTDKIRQRFKSVCFKCRWKLSRSDSAANDSLSGIESTNRHYGSTECVS